MVKKSHSPEQIINKLRKVEVLLSRGATLAVIWKKIGVSDCTYYRWRREYGGMRLEQAKSGSIIRLDHIVLRYRPPAPEAIMPLIMPMGLT
jgi:transposase-like protein